MRLRKIDKIIIAIGISTPIWLPILSFINTIKSCMYKETEVWVLNNKNINQVTGQIEDITPPILISGDDVSSKKPNVNGYGSARLKLKGKNKEVLVEVILEQDYKTKKWKVSHFSLYEQKFSLIPTYNLPDKGNMIYKDSPISPYYIDCESLLDFPF